MSNPVRSTESSDNDRSTVPRAVVHKKILDAAEARPDASMEELATGVSGASLRLVEQVLEEYGDPGMTGRTADDTEDTPPNRSTAPDSDDRTAADPGGTSTPEDDSESTTVTGTATTATDTDSTETDRHGSGDGAVADGSPAESTSSATEPGPSSTPSSEATSTPSGRDESSEAGEIEPTNGTRDDAKGPGSTPDVTQLTHKQLQTLRAIRDDGDATQGELAERLGVSRAAICQRVNAVDGFEWSNRGRFVEALFEDERLQTNGYVRTDRQSQELADRVDELADRLERIEGRLAECPTESTFDIDDPELAHKVVHACLHSERISEAEELAIVRCLFPRDGVRE